MRATLPDITQTDAAFVCYHCGDSIADTGVVSEGKTFCCSGCKTVYEILSRNDLCQYYTLDSTPGHSPLLHASGRYAYLEDESTTSRLIDFTNGKRTSVSFTVPGMHCASCVWLLEHLYRLDEGILESRVDFLKKRISVHFDPRATSLRSVVELLTSLGYEPDLNLGSLEKEAAHDSTRSLVAKIGVAGFAFGNIMLLSFPEYFATSDVDFGMRRFFDWVMLGLSLPVAFYSASDYFVSAWNGFRHRMISIDVPLALGIAILFLRSVIDVAVMGRAGFFDSLSGLVFLLLVGKVAQSRTYDRLAFDRRMSSYLPLAVSVIRNGVESTVPVTALNPGMKLVIRHREIVPCDARVLTGDAAIDYSFVTGESTPVPLQPGDYVYAGGRQIGTSIEAEVAKHVPHSHLTDLWNRGETSDHDVSAPDSGVKNRFLTLSTMIGKWFTIGVLLLTGATGGFWLIVEPARALDAVTGILIVACPCAFAIAAPFAYGSVQRIFGQNHFYLRNISVVESLARVGMIIFDKTGTLTRSPSALAQYEGEPLTAVQRLLVSSVVRHSTHPLSRAIASSIDSPGRLSVTDFQERPGEGVCGMVEGVEVRVGSRAFAGGRALDSPAEGRTETLTAWISINHRVVGRFSVRQEFRDGLGSTISRLAGRFRLALLSGDHRGERKTFEEIFPKGSELLFGQTPENKRDYVRRKQSDGTSLLMVGDGLNDAGALLQSNVGVAITDDINSFSPACDAILHGSHLHQIPDFLAVSRLSLWIIVGAFGLSLLYNILAVGVAIQGHLSPLFAAILMPASSITVAGLTILGIHIAARRHGMIL